MRHLMTSSLRFSSLMRRMALLPVFFLLFFGAENGLAKTLKQHLIWCYCGPGANRYPVYAWFLAYSPVPSIYEQFPFLASLDHQGGSLGGVYYFPYGKQINSSSQPNFADYYYYDTGAYSDIQVPDTVTDNFINSINQQYLSLTSRERAAITGLTIAHVDKADGSYEDVSYFNHRNIGSSFLDGVITYDRTGDVVLSSASGTGYASGYELQADGSFSPVYYQVSSDGTVTKQDTIPTSDYSQLTYNQDIGQYSLDVPDYSAKLDTIISKIDNVELTVPAPVVNVNPELNVTVPPPEVTVNPEINLNPDVTVNVPAPEVIVTIPDSISSTLGDISSSVSNIQDNTDVSGDIASMPSFADLTLTDEEQNLVSRYSDWETNIPLVGDAVDFGLTTLFGQLPTVGTEYVWLDYTIGTRSSSKASTSSKASASSSVNPLNGYRIRIDLTAYREVLLAARGVMVIGEALFFLVLCYRDIKKALSV